MTRIVAVLVVFAIAGSVVFRTVSQAEPPRISPRGRFQSSIELPTAKPVIQSAGKIVLTGCQIKLLYEVPVAAERAGVLDQVASEGQLVKKGEMVAHTRDHLLKAALAVATKQSLNDVEVRYARKASELAQVEYERDLQANSIVRGTVSDLSLRAHRLAAEKALLQLEQAQTSMEIEKLKRNETLELLQTHQVQSPMEAVVRTVFKKRGESVAEGEPILELVNTSRVKVEGYVHIKNLDSVQVGSPVEVQLDVPELDLPGERLTFPGRVVFVDVKVEPVTHQVKVWAEVSNPQAVLKDGLTARMTIKRQ